MIDKHNPIRKAETLEREFAGLVITQLFRKSKMAKRMNNGQGLEQIQPATLGMTRRRKSVVDFIATHVS